MKALIYKDLVAVWKYCRRYLFLCGAMLVLSVFLEEYTFLQMYPLLLIGSLGSTLIAYDERDHWDRQVLTMPVTRKQYVTAKYLTCLLLQGPVLVLTAGAHGLRLGMSGIFLGEVFWADVGVMLLLGSASASLILPFVFRNGSEKGRMAYLIVIAAVFAMTAVSAVVVKKLNLSELAVQLPASVVMAALAAALYPASWALSVYWYGKREF